MQEKRNKTQCFSVDTTILVANATVSSRLEYCNPLLYGVSKSNIAKLQKD